MKVFSCIGILHKKSERKSQSGLNVSSFKVNHLREQTRRFRQTYNVVNDVFKFKFASNKKKIIS